MFISSSARKLVGFDFRNQLDEYILIFRFQSGDDLIVSQLQRADTEHIVFLCDLHVYPYLSSRLDYVEKIDVQIVAFEDIFHL